MTAVTGGCLCGGVRYALGHVPDDVAHCHCSICRRSAGAPFLTWATVERTDLAVTGEVRWFRSSSVAVRGFCPTCGTQLFFAQDVSGGEATAFPLTTPPLAEPRGATTIDVTVASFDDPDVVRPARNIWVGTRLAFLHGFDAALPDHGGEDARDA